MNFSRVWGMPSADTFDCEPIKGFVQKYLMASKVSVDPFARNKRWATHTNDLNPETSAEYHLEAEKFLGVVKYRGILPDLAIFDPPYSISQVALSYSGIGLKFNGKENPTGGFPMVRDLIAEILTPEGICLSFGWNSTGLGKSRGFEIIEVLLVCHGGNHNDTICVAERRISNPQTVLALGGEEPGVDSVPGCATWKQGLKH